MDLAQRGRRDFGHAVVDVCVVCDIITVSCTHFTGADKCVPVPLLEESEHAADLRVPCIGWSWWLLAMHEGLQSCELSAMGALQRNMSFIWCRSDNQQVAQLQYYAWAGVNLALAIAAASSSANSKSTAGCAPQMCKSTLDGAYWQLV